MLYKKFMWFYTFECCIILLKTIQICKPIMVIVHESQNVTVFRLEVCVFL